MLKSKLIEPRTINILLIIPYSTNHGLIEYKKIIIYYGPFLRWKTLQNLRTSKQLKPIKH